MEVNQVESLHFEEDMEVGNETTDDATVGEGEEGNNLIEYDFDYESVASSMASNSPPNSITESDIEMVNAAGEMEEQKGETSIVSAHRRSLTPDEERQLIEMSSEAKCSPVHDLHRNGRYHWDDTSLRRQRALHRVRRSRAYWFEQQDQSSYLDRVEYHGDADVTSSISPSDREDKKPADSYCFDITL